MKKNPKKVGPKKPWSKRPKRKARPGMDRYGRTDLHNVMVPLKGKINLKTLQRLLDGGADHNLQDDAGYTPLHFAAQERSVEAVRLLLTAGARVDVQDRIGNTPLSIAIAHGHDIDVVKLLIDAGADPHLKNDYGFSAADRADTTRFKVDNPQIAAFYREAEALIQKKKARARRKT
jgi:uncharacterized protein